MGKCRVITKQEIREFKEHGSWRELVALAAEIAADAEKHAGGASMNPLMGGGTRLMLALDHRMSDDVDLFIHDAQWIGFLTPRLNEAFEDRLSGYEEDATWVKLKHQHGEIDFIVSGSLLNRKPECDPTLPFALEPVEEVIAKKLFYRGWTLTARDLFDWKTVSEHPQYRHVPDVLATVLAADRLALLATAVEKLSVLPQAATQWQAIRAADLPALPEAIMWAKAELQSLAEREAWIARERAERRIEASEDRNLGEDKGR